VRLDGKAGGRLGVRSQDNDLIVLVGPDVSGHFSAKRRMRPDRRTVFGEK
jgi:hypothetical protein